MLTNYVCAVDIGSHKIAATVAIIKKNTIEKVFCEQFISKGVNRGFIVDSMELATCLSNVLVNLKRKSGLPIKSVLVNVSCHDIVTRHSRAIFLLLSGAIKLLPILTFSM